MTTKRSIGAMVCDGVIPYWVEVRGDLTAVLEQLGHPETVQTSIAASARRMGLIEPFRTIPRRNTAQEQRRCIADIALRRQQELKAQQRQLDSGSQQRGGQQ